MFKTILVMGLSVFLSACLMTAQTELETKFPVGSQFTDKIELPQGDILLPQGEWTVLAIDIGRNNTYEAFGSLVLGKIDANNTLRGFITIASPMSAGMGYAFYSNSFCDQQQNYLVHQTNGNHDFGYQSCFGIKKKTLAAFDGFKDYVKLGTKYLVTKRTDRPYDMISSAFRITRGHKFLYVEYGFDYRQSAIEMLPGYESGEAVELGRYFFPEEKTDNVKAVIRWSLVNGPKIEDAFLN